MKPITIQDSEPFMIDVYRMVLVAIPEDARHPKIRFDSGRWSLEMNLLRPSADFETYILPDPIIGKWKMVGYQNKGTNHSVLLMDVTA